MPGALPERRIRRDAPRPSVARGNAVNSIVAMLATPSWVCGLPGSIPVVRDGQRAPQSGVPRKAFDFNRICFYREPECWYVASERRSGLARLAMGAPTD